MFSNQDLKRLIVPLFLEQLLVLLVGMADVFVIGFVGEAAVSGVSLVNSFNTIFLDLFTALAAGGAVVISQYIGRDEKDLASRSACQLAAAAALFSVAAAVFILLNCEPLLRLLFGKVEPEVMEACITYLKISAYSYPALAVYNAGAALYRSFGKTSTTMYIFHPFQLHQCGGQLHRRVWITCWCGRCGMAFPHCPHFLGGGHHGAVLLEKESGVLLLERSAAAGRQFAGEDSAHRRAQRF